MSTKTVLVAEDDPGMRELLRYRLTHAGYEVTSVKDGNSALQAIIDLRPDVALLDRGLPGMDGFEVLKQVRSDQRVAGLRVVIISGRDLDLDDDQIAFLHPDAYLHKPVEPEEVLACLAGQVVDGSTSHRSEGDDSEDGVFDLGIVRSWLSDEEQVRAYVLRFLQGHELQVRELVDAARGNDIARCRAVAHRLAGTLANLGAARAAGRVREVERLARKGIIDGIDRAVLEIRYVATVLTAWLESGSGK